MPKFVTEEIIQNQKILSNIVEENLIQITNPREIEQMTSKVYNEVLVMIDESNPEIKNISSKKTNFANQKLSFN